jgi:hypothetical protein
VKPPPSARRTKNLVTKLQSKESGSRCKWRLELNFCPLEGHFTHETESPWPLHFKYFHWWKRRSRSKFASHYARGTNKVYKCKIDVKVHMDSHMTLNGSCSIVTWIILKNHLLEVGLTQNQETMTILNSHECWFILFYHVWGLAWIDFRWNSIWLRARSTYGFTIHLRVRDRTTWFWRCVGMAFGHFLLGSHNFTVTALGLCVKWPLQCFLWDTAWIHPYLLWWFIIVLAWAKFGAKYIGHREPTCWQ